MVVRKKFCYEIVILAGVALAGSIQAQRFIKHTAR